MYSLPLLPLDFQYDRQVEALPAQVPLRTAQTSVSGEVPPIAYIILGVVAIVALIALVAVVKKR